MFTLDVFPGYYAICRIDPAMSVPGDVWSAPGLVSVTRTSAELSVVCPESHAPEGATVEPGWRVLAVEGPLDFELTGILASLTQSLARARLSVFAVSTYDTDYLLVRATQLDQAITALTDAGHRVTG